MNQTPKIIEFELTSSMERDIDEIMSRFGITEKQHALEQMISLGILSVERKTLLGKLAALDDLISLELKNMSRNSDPELPFATQIPNN